MIAKIKMAKETSSPICIRGARALKIDLRTTCKPENNTVSTVRTHTLGSGEVFNEKYLVYNGHASVILECSTNKKVTTLGG